MRPAVSSSRPRAVLARRRQERPGSGAPDAPDPVIETPKALRAEPAPRSRRRRGPRGLKLRQRLGVIVFALFVVCAVVGLAFLVGYIVGKIFL
jgi:hypothetical protein